MTLKIVYRVTVLQDGREPDVVEYDEVDLGGAQIAYNSSIGGADSVTLEKVTYEQRDVVVLEHSEVK